MSSERKENASRREFLQATIGSAAVAAVAATSFDSLAQEKSAAPLKISVFSKHLQWLELEAMAQTISFNCYCRL